MDWIARLAPATIRLTDSCRALDLITQVVYATRATRDARVK